jgi:uncharacterized protein
LLVSLEHFQQRVESATELEALIGLPSELVIRKQLSELDEHMKSFIGESPFMLLGTAGTNGMCDVSPRGDVPSVARVLDLHTVVIAERPGNRRADSMRNIIETGRVGLLFLVPGMGETLRINGRACVFRDEEALSTLAINGKQPVVGIGVEVEECYFQCAKALIRSDHWESNGQHPHATSCHFAKMLIDQTDIEGETVESLGMQIEDSYQNRLY